MNDQKISWLKELFAKIMNHVRNVSFVFNSIHFIFETGFILVKLTYYILYLLYAISAMSWHNFFLFLNLINLVLRARTDYDNPSAAPNF